MVSNKDETESVESEDDAVWRPRSSKSIVSSILFTVVRRSDVIGGVTVEIVEDRLYLYQIQVTC